MTSEEWVASRDALFEPLGPSYPTLGRLSRTPGVDMSLEALFECGLALLLDGLAAKTRAIAEEEGRKP